MNDIAPPNFAPSNDSRTAIRVALEPFTMLTPKQREKMAVAIETGAEKLGRENRLLQYPAFLEFERKANQVVAAFAEDGLTLDAYVGKAVRQQPTLLSRTPERIIDNVRAMVEEFAPAGLTTKQYVNAALYVPQLFYQPKATLASHIRELVGLFAGEGLTTKQYLEAALERPQLFTMLPKTVENNIRGMVAEFKKEGLTTEQYLAAALRKPQLFYQSPARTIGNIRGVVEQFKEEGLTAEQYLAAALSMPQLFCQDPETIGKHGYYVAQALKSLGSSLSFGEFVKTAPAALALSSENLLGRTILAQQGLFESAPSSLLKVMPKAQMQQRLIEHYQPRGRHGERVLQTLHHIGTLDQLPEGMAPLSDERSKGILARELAKREAAKEKQGKKER